MDATLAVAVVGTAVPAGVRFPLIVEPMDVGILHHPLGTTHRPPGTAVVVAAMSRPRIAVTVSALLLLAEVVILTIVEEEAVREPPRLAGPCLR